MLVVVTGDAPEIARRGRRTRTFRYLGRVAAKKNLTVFFTTPDRFRWPSNRQEPAPTEGWRFDPAKDGFTRHKAKLRPAGVVVYDAMYLEDLRAHGTDYRRTYQAWVRHHYRFFNPILPPKDKLYHELATRDLAPARLPKTWFRMTPDLVLQLLETTPKLWLKPVVGSGGRNIVIVERMDGGRYHVVSERFFGTSLDEQVDARGLRRRLAAAMKRRPYMAQEEVPLLTNAQGQKIDFRATVVRRRANDWQTIAVTARMGARGSRLTNFHAGGSVHSPSDLMMREEDIPGDVQRALLDNIRQGAVQVARALQKNHPLMGLLGVDAGVTQDGTIYVYDFNGRPGRDILKDHEVNQAMEAIVDYGRSLLEDVSRNGNVPLVHVTVRRPVHVRRVVQTRSNDSQPEKKQPSLRKGVSAPKPMLRLPKR